MAWNSSGDALIRSCTTCGLRDTDLKPRRPEPRVKAATESLPLGDATVDTAVIAYALCSVHNPMRCLSEVRRVLRPGGRALLLEHGLSSEAKRAFNSSQINRCDRRSAGYRSSCKFLHRAGGIPNSRLNARLNASSDSYPTEWASWAMVLRVSLRFALAL